MKKQNGFTLIELMIVVAIIGVLSAIAVPAYKNYVKSSEAATGLSTVRALLTNIDMYEQDNSAFPSNDIAGFTAIGAASDMSHLGTLSLTTDSVKFAFSADAALTTKAITYTKTASGWKCTHDTDLTLKSCS